MLFTKKKRFEVTEKQIREDLKTENGDVIVKINIRYPLIICPKNDKLQLNACPLYIKVAENLAQYARGEMFKNALKVYNSCPDKFSPFSAVMRFEKTFEDSDYLSVILDISICNGIDAPATDRKTQVWDRKNGLKCKCSHFLEVKDIKNKLDEEDKKNFDKELFVLRENGIEFFIRQKGSYKSLIMPIAKNK